MAIKKKKFFLNGHFDLYICISILAFDDLSDMIKMM